MSPFLCYFWLNDSPIIIFPMVYDICRVCLRIGHDHRRSYVITNKLRVSCVNLIAIRKNITCRCYI
jgi:hypothetical protein